MVILSGFSGEVRYLLFKNSDYLWSLVFFSVGFFSFLLFIGSFLSPSLNYIVKRYKSVQVLVSVLGVFTGLYIGVLIMWGLLTPTTYQRYKSESLYESVSGGDIDQTKVNLGGVSLDLEEVYSSSQLELKFLGKWDGYKPGFSLDSEDKYPYDLIGLKGNKPLGYHIKRITFVRSTGWKEG